MGYSTDFFGLLTLSEPLTDEQLDYLEKFRRSRRMKRDVKILCELDKGENGFPGMTLETNTPEEVYGVDGEYYVGDGCEESIIDHNLPPGQLGFSSMDFSEVYKENKKRIEQGSCQPGLWCQWEVSNKASNKQQVLVWDGGEKFYYYTEWLKYLINHFFSKWGVMLNGSIEWEGEENSDKGIIVVKENQVKIGTAKITYDFD